MKADDIWEWKQANGDRGTCPRSRLRWNPDFQCLCPGLDSRLTQAFPPWPLLQPFGVGWTFPLAFPPISHHLLGSHLLRGQTWEEMAERRGQMSEEMAQQPARRALSPITSSCQSQMLRKDGEETHSRQLWNGLPLGKFPLNCCQLKDDLWPRARSFFSFFFFNIYYLNSRCSCYPDLFMLGLPNLS